MALCPHGCNHQHISLDIDKPFGTFDLPSVFECAHKRKSAGGNTHYLICWPNSHELKAEAMFTIRTLLHDDLERVEADRARYIVTREIRFAEGILFDNKNNDYAGEWQ